MTAIVELNKIKKVYGARGVAYTALHEFDLTVSRGEFVGIMGPSGAGKTTLLHILATIDEPTSGSVVIDGTDLLTLNEEKLSAFRREKLGFIFQDYNLLDTLTVKENILLPLALAKSDAREMERKAHELADKFGIRALLDQYPYQLSGGQKQRTAASRAIVSGPSLLLADEPTGALDSKSATDLLESLKALNEQDGMTILLVTHDAYAASYCSRVLFINDGRLFAELVRGDAGRKTFFGRILDVLAVLGGGGHDVH